MKKKLFKFLIAISVVMVFASVASLAATIDIVEDSMEINVDTGEVSINFTTSEDMEDTDQISALVYSGEANPEPAETDVVYIDQNTKSSYNGTLSFKMKEEATPGATYTLRMGGTGVTTAAEYDFVYENPMKTVTIGATTGNGIVEFSTTAENSVTVEKGTEVYLNITPAIGYYISSIMENSDEKAVSIDAYKGGTYKYTANADAEFTVTFTKITNVTDEITAETGMTGTDALTLPEVFRGKDTDDATEDVSIAFGQIAPAAGEEVVSYGIYLTKQNGDDVTTMKPGVGPKFAHNPQKGLSAENQFGIIFEQIKPGSYFAQTYIEYTDGTIVKGIKVPFTVTE